VLGGGPPYSLPSLLAETLASAVGVVGSGVLAGAVAIVVAGLFLEALYYQARRRDDRWVFYAVTVVAAPAFLLLAARPPFLFVRYFATQVAFVTVLLGATWAVRWRAGGASGFVASCLLVAYLGTSGLAIVRLWSLGRGHYREALTQMCADVEHGPIRVASDHDFRNGMMIRYYTRHGSPGCEIAYATRADVQHERADWFVTHEVGAVTEPSAELADAGGNKYSFVRSYPSHELSGMTWHVYRASPALTGR